MDLFKKLQRAQCLGFESVQGPTANQPTFTLLKLASTQLKYHKTILLKTQQNLAVLYTILYWLQQIRLDLLTIVQNSELHKEHRPIFFAVLLSLILDGF